MRARFYQPLVEEPAIPGPDETLLASETAEIKETENEPEPELKPQTEETLPEWVEEEQEHLASSTPLYPSTQNTRNRQLALK